MNYHNILHNDMLNGDGFRTVLFVSGCSLHCKNCQNPQTWNKESGILFDESAKEEIFTSTFRTSVAIYELMSAFFAIVKL